MVPGIAQRFGRPHVLVDNAAVRRESAFARLTYGERRVAPAVCVDGAFHCTQAALPLLQKSEAGAIVNPGLTAHTAAAFGQLSASNRATGVQVVDLLRCVS